MCLSYDMTDMHAGKSTVTGMLARALAASSEDINVGVLDIDLCGPSQPRVFGVQGEQVGRKR